MKERERFFKIIIIIFFSVYCVVLKKKKKNLWVIFIKTTPSNELTFLFEKKKRTFLLWLQSKKEIEEIGKHGEKKTFFKRER